MYNVLIADDDVDAWFQLNAMLRRHRMKASFVTNLGAARQHVDQHNFSLIFLEKQLKDNSATDFIKYVRAKSPSVKIILIGGHGEELNGLKSRVDMTITKPLIPEIIERTINRFHLPV